MVAGPGKHFEDSNQASRCGVGKRPGIVHAKSLETPNVATYAMDAIGFLEPQDDVEKLIAEFDSGKGELKARAMIVRAIARSFSDPQRLANGDTRRSGNKAKILAFLPSQATNESMGIACEATLMLNLLRRGWLQRNGLATRRT